MYLTSSLSFSANHYKFSLRIIYVSQCKKHPLSTKKPEKSEMWKTEVVDNPKIDLAENEKLNLLSNDQPLRW